MTDRRLAVAAWESLFRAQHEVFEEISSDFAGTDLAQGEYDVLLTVTRAPGMVARLRDVTANMLISQPSVSRLVDRMVARGLLSKCADPDDGRGSLVRATEEGAMAFRRIAHAASIADRMSLLSDDELNQLRDLTAKLRKPLPDC
jgi:DNA-binding MarR family transcriptional regulator